MFKSVKVGGRGASGTLVLGHFEGQGLDKQSREHDVDGLAAAAAKRPEATGAVGQLAESYPAGGGKGVPDRVVLLGLGPKAEFSPGVLRTAVASLGRRLAQVKARAIALELAPALASVKADLGECGKCAGEAIGLLAWDDSAYRGSATPAREVEPIALRSSDRSFTQGLKFGLGLAESANVARTLSHAPPNVCTPEHVAAEARKLARATGMSCSVVKGDKLLDEGLVGMHTVGQASDHTPCLVRLEYTPESARRGAKPVVLVGKTITYDSGGLSLKVGGTMRGMKRDMDGGAGVFGAMHAIATTIKPRRRVIAYLCCAENAISDEAYRPDDVMHYPNGVTVEVTNTDAEGRLVLADGLIRACQDKPACVIDMATLTGGVVVALGGTYAGMWCDDDKLRAAVEEAAERSGERVWRLPLHTEYREMMRSDAADIVNSAPVRAAHPIQGAAFLSYFVEEGIPWCHLDIAGVHSVDRDKGPYIKNSATGFGARLLAELLDRY